MSQQLSLKYKQEWAHITSSDSFTGNGLDVSVQVCVLTKKKHVDLTVGASGNLSERTPKSERARKINTRLEECVKHLQSVLCTDGITFTGTAANY